MYSNRMRTAHSCSRLPQCMLEYPPDCGPGDPHGCGPGDPLRCGLGDPPGQTPQLPPGCGPGDTPRPDSQLPPWVSAWKPARHAGIPPPPPLMNRMTDRCKNITLPQTSFAGGKYSIPYSEQNNLHLGECEMKI